MTTNWTRYDVPALVAILDEDLESSWRQVLAWEQTFSLLNGHSSRLGLARDALAETWPPDRSPASNAFMANVDQTVSSMSSTADAALANRDALTGVLTALEAARAKVDTLHQEWQTLAFEESQMSVGGVISVAVPHDWKRQLNAQAHAIMNDTDQAIFESTQKMVIPSGLEDPGEPFKPLTIGGPTASAGAGVPSTAVPASGAKTFGPDRPEIRSAPSANGGSTEEPPSGSRPSQAADPVSIRPPTPPTENNPIGTPDEPVDLIAGSAAEQIAEELGVAAGPALAASIAGRQLDPSVTTPRTTPKIESIEPDVKPAPDQVAGGPFVSGGIGREDDGRRQSSRRNTRWSVAAGLPGLIEPDEREPDYDPGPGVIGLDR